MAFDEQSYLAANPDVAAAVASGDFASGAQHYQMYGASEGRAGGVGSGGADVFVDREFASPVSAPAGQPNWASGAGYATNITAAPGTPAYYSQLNDAMAAYRAGSGVNPITGKMASDEAGTFWNAGSGMLNYFQANPDVAMNYMVNAGGKGVDPQQYALSHFDMTTANSEGGRQGVLPTGQTNIERIVGKSGGSLYDIFGAPGFFPSVSRGITTPEGDLAKYRSTFGNSMSDFGPFAGLDWHSQRQALAPSLTAKFNGLIGSSAAPRASSGSSSGTSSSGPTSGVTYSAPSSSGILSSSSAATSGASSGQPVTVSGSINNLLSTDEYGNFTNQVVRQAADRAMQAFAARGLLNSSMATQAAQEAAISKATEIASADASAINDFTKQANQNSFTASQNALDRSWDREKLGLQNEFTASQDQTTQSINLRNNYLSSMQTITSNYQQMVNNINSSQMTPEAKSAALANAAVVRDSEISYTNSMYSKQQGWSPQWAAAAVPLTSSIDSINDVATLKNIASDVAQSDATRKAAYDRIAYLNSTGSASSSSSSSGSMPDQSSGYAVIER